MEKRNQYNSPRDRIDDTLLIRLLNEEEPMSEYNCMGERRTGRTSCADTMPNRSGRRTGCASREERQEYTGCGDSHAHHGNCGEMRQYQNRSGCGCTNPRESRDNDGCGETCARGGHLSGYALAMVYAPDQEWEDLFDEEEALEHGTMFRRLELPFYPGKCGCGCK